jgi:hypothetical protein
VPHCLLSAREDWEAFMASEMILVVVAAGIVASAVVGMLNNGRFF